MEAGRLDVCPQILPASAALRNLRPRSDDVANNILTVMKLYPAHENPSGEHKTTNLVWVRAVFLDEIAEALTRTVGLASYFQRPPF